MYMMSFFVLFFLLFTILFPGACQITVLNVFPFGVTFNSFFLSVFEHCRDPGAQGRSLSYTFGKESEFGILGQLRTDKLDFLNSMEFNSKVVQVVQNKIEAYPFLGYKVILNRSAQVQVIYGWYPTWLLLSSLQNSANITTSN